MTRIQRQLTETLLHHLTGSPVAVPEGGRLAWRWFTDLNAARSYGMAGPNPISYAEIEAYARLHRWPLEPRHVDLITAMDRAWLDHAWVGVGKSHLGSSAGRGQEMTPEAFDAVFC